MGLPSSFFRDDFQLKENHFALPEDSINLDPRKKRALTICNLFVNISCRWQTSNLSSTKTQQESYRCSLSVASFKNGGKPQAGRQQPQNCVHQGEGN